MASDPRYTLQRREFLKVAGAAATVAMSETALAVSRSDISIVVDQGDAIASSAPVKCAIAQLQRALTDGGVTSSIVPDLSAVRSASHVVVVAGEHSTLAKSFPAPVSALDTPESVRITPGRLAGVPATWVSGIDMRGFVFGILELADRVQFSSNPNLALVLKELIVEQTANKVRCVARAFCSDVEDKDWFYNKDFWREYLSALATSRFNRFAFVFGFGYDFPKGVTGDYFHFPYPYLVDVPGYHVRVEPLAPGERERNLAMLQFIAAETAARGMDFQLGIWTHAYEWTDSPKSDHHVTGLNADNHADYCRDALALLLKACPEISGLTLRVHGESGVPEGSYSFWKTLFEAISGSGRKIEIDMHAKGINQIMIDMASDTGMPVKVSAKSWAEHMGLGYHQADIRELEIPRPDRMETGIFNISNGERRFTRYGYADLYQKGRKYDVLYRLWPGTQRHLLWGDPEMAAAYGRTANFCGAAGIEICEPLTFKGREGSGRPGGRCAYLDHSLNPKTGDWQKFEYSYRLWGRMLYNPDTKPEVWQRYLNKNFGHASDSVEKAVANASRVLALITTSHLPSASNHSFWPEIYENMPIVLGGERSPYSDTPDPKCFGTVSPLDPQLFSTVVDHVHDLLVGRASPKYSPAEVALWLEEYTGVAARSLTLAQTQAASRSTPAFRRMEEDVLIQIGLGQFFAAKLRSAMLYEIYQQTGNEEAGRLALAAYQKGRSFWAGMANRAKGVYGTDISYGNIPMRRGHWIDRIPNIDKDIAAMQAKLKDGSPSHSGNSAHTRAAIESVTTTPGRPMYGCSHSAPAGFSPGQPLMLSLRLTGGEGTPTEIHLYYRHVNQGERWMSVPMEKKQHSFDAEIPGGYTQSPYPLQYYFVLAKDTSAAWFYPAFNATLSNQPYYSLTERVR